MGQSGTHRLIKSYRKSFGREVSPSFLSGEKSERKEGRKEGWEEVEFEAKELTCLKGKIRIYKQYVSF